MLRSWGCPNPFQVHSKSVRLYDRLFLNEDLDEVEEGKDFTDYLNPDSLERIQDAKVEPSLESVGPGMRLQFERQGYFAVDSDSSSEKLVFNRTVSLKDTWAKIVARSKNR